MALMTSRWLFPMHATAAPPPPTASITFRPSSRSIYMHLNMLSMASLQSEAQHALAWHSHRWGLWMWDGVVAWIPSALSRCSRSSWVLLVFEGEAAFHYRSEIAHALNISRISVLTRKFKRALLYVTSHANLDFRIQGNRNDFNIQ